MGEAHERRRREGQRAQAAVPQRRALFAVKRALSGGDARPAWPPSQSTCSAPIRAASTHVDRAPRSTLAGAVHPAVPNKRARSCQGSERTTAPNLAAATMASAAQSPMPSASLMLSSAPPCEQGHQGGGGSGARRARPMLPARSSTSRIFVHRKQTNEQPLLPGALLDPHQSHSQSGRGRSCRRRGRGRHGRQCSGRGPSIGSPQPPIKFAAPAISSQPRQLTQTGSRLATQRPPPATAWRAGLRLGRFQRSACGGSAAGGWRSLRFKWPARSSCCCRSSRCTVVLC